MSTEAPAPSPNGSRSARPPLLRVDGLSTHFNTDRGVLQAVDDVSLELASGKTLAIVGESGSGKSVLTRSILGLHASTNLAHTSGRVVLDGIDLRALPPRELRQVWKHRVGLVSQNPMVALNPVVRIGRQITEVLRKNLGLRAGPARTRAAELLDAVGIPEPRRRLREYPHQLSGGLRQRVTIAIAIACEPQLLIADEPTTALDVTVQAQILSLLKGLQRERDMAMIFISHDLGVVAGLADQIAVMYGGRIIERAPARSMFARPRNPYTAGLLAASPRIGRPGVTLEVVPGRPPDMVDPPPGCRFHPRCASATARCATDEPPLIAGEPNHECACWHPRDAEDHVDHEEVGHGG